MAGLITSYVDRQELEQLQRQFNQTAKQLDITEDALRARGQTIERLERMIADISIRLKAVNPELAREFGL